MKGLSKFIARIIVLVILAALGRLGYQQFTQQEGLKVIKVADGDTVTLLDADRKDKIKVRLHGIDCPEKKQAFGQKARQFTADLCFQKYVELRELDRDRYGRVVGEIILPDGRNLNHELLRAGLAWHYRAYSDDPEYAQLEQEARAAERGLWSAPRPQAPWEYRKRERERRKAS